MGGIGGLSLGVYVQLDIFCVLIIIGMAVAARFCLNKTSKQVKPLILLVGWCYGLAMLADASRILFIEEMKMNRVLFWMANDLYFVLLMLGAYFWLIYVLTKEKVKGARRKDVRVLLIIPVMVVGIFVVLAPVNGWIYKYVSDKYFMRGAFYVLFIAVLILYYLTAIVVSLISAVKVKAERRMLYFNIAVASLVAVAGDLLQYHRANNYLCIGLTSSLLIFFFNRVIKTGWEQQTEISRFSEVMNCLRQDYTSIFFVDFKKDALVVCQQDEYTKKEYGEIAQKGVYSEILQYVCDHGVFSGDKNAFRESIKPDYVKKQLKKNKVFSTRFRVLRNKETLFVEMRFWPVADNEDPDKVILGFLNINDVVRTERDNLDQSRAIQYMTLAQALTDHFKSIYYVNVSDNTYTVMGMDDDYRDKVASFMVDQNDFFKDMLTNVQKVVYEDDRHIIRDFFSKEKLLRVVERDKKASVDYRLYINGEPQWFRAKVVKGINEIDRDTLVVGVSGISDEKNSEIDRTQSQQVIKALAGEYTGLYYVNILTGVIKVYSVSDRTGKIVGQKDIDFTTAFTSFIKASVHPDDDKLLKDALMSYREMLSEKQSFSIMFRRNYNGEYLYTEMVVYKNEPINDPVRSVVIGFRERDKEYKAIGE